MIFEKNVSVQKLVLFCSPDQCQSLCLDAKGFGWRNTHLRRYTEWAPLNWKRERDRGRFCMWVIEGEREIMRKRPRPIRSIDWAGGVRLKCRRSFSCSLFLSLLFQNCRNKKSLVSLETIIYFMPRAANPLRLSVSQTHTHTPTTHPHTQRFSVLIVCKQ